MGGAGVEHLLQLFAKGSLVEVGSDEEGFKGARYVATVIDIPSRSAKKKKKNPNSCKLFVEYQSLLDDDGVTPLREYVNFDLVRPLPPPPSEINPVHSFELYDVVDAFYRDGWWTGVITRVFDNSRFVVTFHNPPDEIEFGIPDLRVHLEWVDDRWLRPEKQRTTGLMFCSGRSVEVSFDKEDCHDVWFPATVLEDLGNNSFLVEYQCLVNDDEVALLKATVDLLHIRPAPPHLKDRNFVLLEKVDAFYHFGWWSGVITKVLAERRYIIYFKHTNKDMELSQSELRPHMEWIDGKWIAASQDVLIPPDYQEQVGHATQMAVQLASSGATQVNSGERTSSLNSRENQTEQSTPCNRKPSSYGMASLRKKTKQKNPDSDASHSRPSKKLKEGNTPETSSLTTNQTNTMLIQTPCKENICGFSSPATGGAGTNSLKQSMDGDQTSAKTQSRSRGTKIQNKQQKVGELDNLTTGVVKRKGRRSKFQVKRPEPSTGGKKGYAGVGTAAEFDEKECITNEVDIPVIIGLACNGMKSPQARTPHQFPIDESLKSISDQKDQFNDPARHRTKEISQLKGGETSPKKRRGRPPKLLGGSPNPSVAGAGSKKLLNRPTVHKNVVSSMMKMPSAKEEKLPNEKVMQASSKQLEKPSTKRGRKQSAGVNNESPIQDFQEAFTEKGEDGFRSDSVMKEVGMALDEVPSNASDDLPLSTWFEGMHSPTTVDGSRVSPNRTVQQCTETSERELQMAMQAAAVGGNGVIVPDPNQSLPFLKTFPLWETIESMEVFQVMPQKPHFRPLDVCKESSREGLAIGCMVTFSSVIKKTSELQFDDPRSSIEDSLETLLDLEGHGFDVKMARDRLTSLLLIKDRQELLQDQSKELESRIMEHGHEKTKIDVEIDSIDKQIRELQEKRALAISKKEVKDSEIGSLQSRVNNINEGIKSIQLEFEELAAASW